MWLYRTGWEANTPKYCPGIVCTSSEDEGEHDIRIQSNLRYWITSLAEVGEQRWNHQQSWKPINFWGGCLLPSQSSLMKGMILCLLMSPYILKWACTGSTWRDSYQCLGNHCGTIPQIDYDSCWYLFRKSWSLYTISITFPITGCCSYINQGLVTQRTMCTTGEGRWSIGLCRLFMPCPSSAYSRSTKPWKSEWSTLKSFQTR